MTWLLQNRWSGRCWREGVIGRPSTGSMGLTCFRTTGVIVVIFADFSSPISQSPGQRVEIWLGKGKRRLWGHVLEESICVEKKDFKKWGYFVGIGDVDLADSAALSTFFFPSFIKKKNSNNNSNAFLMRCFNIKLKFNIFFDGYEKSCLLIS